MEEVNIIPVWQMRNIRDKLEFDLIMLANLKMCKIDIVFHNFFKYPFTCY